MEYSRQKYGRLAFHRIIQRLVFLIHLLLRPSIHAAVPILEGALFPTGTRVKLVLLREPNRDETAL